MRTLCVMIGLLMANTALAKPKSKTVAKPDENSWVSDPSLKTYCEKRIDVWKELRLYAPYLNWNYCSGEGQRCETDRLTKIEYYKQKIEEVTTYRHFAEDSIGHKMVGDFASGDLSNVPEECCKVMPEKFEMWKSTIDKERPAECLYKR